MVIAEDLADPDAPKRIYAAVTDAGVAVDYLINNPGFGARGLFHEMLWGQILSMFQVNATALAGLTRVFLLYFVARNAGCILNVTSTASEMPGPMLAIYFATKGFAAYLSNALVEELSDTDVTVTGRCKQAEMGPQRSIMQFGLRADLSCADHQRPLCP
jgi:short-subunit dehydrogenase